MLEAALVAGKRALEARATFERIRLGAVSTARKKTAKSGPKSRRVYDTTFVNYEVFAWVNKYSMTEAPTTKRIYASLGAAVESWSPMKDDNGYVLCRQGVKGYRITQDKDGVSVLVPKDISKKERWKRIDRRRWRDLAVASYMEKCLLL